MGIYRAMEDFGTALTSQKIVPGNTATGIGANVYQYVERTVAYTSGGTTEIVVGDIIVGGTSSAVATVIGVTLTTGTWAGGDAAGTLRLKNQVGTFQSENLNVRAGSNLATIGGNSAVATATVGAGKSTVAKVAEITVFANNILMTLDGTTPDQTLVHGLVLIPGVVYHIYGATNIRNAKFIDRVASSAGIVNVTCFF